MSLCMVGGYPDAMLSSAGVATRGTRRGRRPVELGGGGLSESIGISRSPGSIRIAEDGDGNMCISEEEVCLGRAVKNLRTSEARKNGAVP